MIRTHSLNSFNPDTHRHCFIPHLFYAFCIALCRYTPLLNLRPLIFGLRTYVWLLFILPIPLFQMGIHFFFMPILSGTQGLGLNL